MAEVKPLKWVGPTKAALVGFPELVRKDVGYELHLAQIGEKGLKTKVLMGFGGAGVLEIVESHDGNAYSAVYTVKFSGVVYVLHVFQKKSKTGIATPTSDIDLIKQRLKVATDHYKKFCGDRK